MNDDAPGYLASHLDTMREHIIALAAALPGLPAEFSRAAGQIGQDWTSKGGQVAASLILAFVLLGFILEGLARFGIGALRRLERTEPASVRERVRAMGLRLARDAGGILAFTLGSAVAFLAFDWPPRMRMAVLGFLAAFVAFRLAMVFAATLLSPRDARLRILPASEAQARHWMRRIALFAGWLAAGWVFGTWLAMVGMDAASRLLVIYLLGLGLLAIAMEGIWRRSRIVALGCVFAWALWVIGAWGSFWTVVVALFLPDLLRLAQAGVDHTLRAPGTALAGESRSVLAAALGRGLRALLLIAAAALLVRAFGLDMASLADADTMWTRLARGTVHALAILIIADVAWKVSAALIDQKLAAVGPATENEAQEDKQRRARLRTLLPIVRSTVLVVLLVMAVLMSLSALGVEVGPLIAGAGVVGVAIGFGSQTLVRDLLSKFFYLLDDAFRVGEYIQSGNYKGTVEHLGVRSVRLRHHRGSLYTIPYGQLGAVQNMSRDWVIDKMTVGVVYGTDLEKVKKIIKRIGAELAANEEFKPQILEPLKMQGVEQFGDFAIQVRMKMKTLPNQQFTIRRRAYAMIQKAFAENGVEFAFPTVQIAGGGSADAGIAAAARQALELGKAS
jgi:small-conductance mechanosensitive channel